MLEIMCALRTLSTACFTHGAAFQWNLDDGDGIPTITAHISIGPRDADFVRQLMELFTTGEED